MKERPILFSGPMVRALLDGRKTQTRRVMKPQPVIQSGPFDHGHWAVTLPHGNAITNECGTLSGAPSCEAGEWNYTGRFVSGYHRTLCGPIRCPYGVPGDRMWVRESFVELLHTSPATDEPIDPTNGDRLIEPATSYVDAQGRKRWHYDGKVIAYRATSNVEFCDGDGFSSPDFANKDDLPRWKPSIHMPRWASRITLEITDVRVQRVQEISEEDAKAEGVGPIGGFVAQLPFDYRVAFKTLWDEINEHRGYGTHKNPWVWCLTFKRVKK
jgi:hypothetical protein